MHASVLHTHLPRTPEHDTPTRPPVARTSPANSLQNPEIPMKTTVASLLVALLFVACASAPSTFVRNAPGWVSVEVADGMTKEVLWGKIADSLKERDLEFEKIDKDAGYMRTSWNFKVTKDKSYATRVIIDFPSNGKIIRMKTEAQYHVEHTFGDAEWVEGFDSGYNQTFKDEISAIVGRK